MKKPAVALVAVALLAVLAPAAPAGAAEVTFQIRAPGAGEVYLAGSFNGWSATDWPLADDGDGNWSIVKKLDAGAHQYKFVVDGSWMTDPENPEAQDDGYGGSNSLVTVASPPPRDSEIRQWRYSGGRHVEPFQTQFSPSASARASKKPVSSATSSNPGTRRPPSRGRSASGPTAPVR